METTNITDQLVSLALTGKHRPQLPILDIRAYFQSLVAMIAFIKVISNFKRTKKSLFKIYRKNIRHNIFTNDEILTAYKTMQACIDYYIIEYNMLDTEVADFTIYWIFHPITTILGFPRRNVVIPEATQEDTENNDTKNDTKGDK